MIASIKINDMISSGVHNVFHCYDQMIGCAICYPVDLLCPDPQAILCSPNGLLMKTSSNNHNLLIMRKYIIMCSATYFLLSGDGIEIMTLHTITSSV